MKFGSQIQGVQGDEPGEAIMLDGSGQVPGGNGGYTFHSTDIAKLKQILDSMEDIDVRVSFKNSANTYNSSACIFEFNAKHGVKSADYDNIVCPAHGDYVRGPRIGGWSGRAWAIHGVERINYHDYDYVSVAAESGYASSDSNTIQIDSFELSIDYSAEPTSTQEE